MSKPDLEAAISLVTEYDSYRGTGSAVRRHAMATRLGITLQVLYQRVGRARNAIARRANNDPPSVGAHIIASESMDDLMCRWLILAIDDLGLSSDDGDRLLAHFSRWRYSNEQ